MNGRGRSRQSTSTTRAGRSKRGDVESEEWVVLELNPRSEGEDPEIIRRSIQHSVRGAEVFVPAVVTKVGEDRVFHYLVEGYAFVKKTLPDSAYLKLENTRFVQGVLSASGIGRARKLATVKASDIENFRQQIREEVDQGIAVGDKVLITIGAYRNIEASVIEEIPEQAVVQVFVRLRSKQSIVTVPRSGLRILERAPTSPLYNRLSTLRTWLRLARPILLWQGAMPKDLVEREAHLSRIDRWALVYHNLFSFVEFCKGSVDSRILDVPKGLAELTQLTIWLEKAHQLYAFVSSYYKAPEDRIVRVQQQLAELTWLDSVLGRIRALHQEVEAIGLAAARHGDEEVVQNLLVDGHNLAFRCLYAPGMSDLADSQGRPTGMILGFLRSLGALRKRFPEARIYVTWDGSSKRRKTKFPDYKANRASRTGEALSGFDPVAFIKGVLPFLGVWQATNKDEEADDIIAALVRGPLKSEQNLIFSTDRDFLQLVTETTEVLAPGTGNRHEARYTMKMIEEDYGIPPYRMVQLRAFFGDDSDNIPGVPRVPKKVLKALLQAHGSVDGVYNSGLTGLTKAQYERLRSSEPQVRINLDLMSLVDVPVSVQDPDVDPDAATAKLREVEVNPDPICSSFFGRRSTEVADA